MAKTIVLYQPQIPQNTGNIVRTCSVTGASLVLIGPLGFSIQSRHLKRAGLDYWEGVSVSVESDLEAYLSTKDPQRIFFFSSKSKTSYRDVVYPEDAILIFGSETMGLPESLLEKYPDRWVTIPMLPGSRCLNLATSAGIALYEALRPFHAQPL